MTKITIAVKDATLHSFPNSEIFSTFEGSGFSPHFIDLSLSGINLDKIDQTDWGEAKRILTEKFRQETIRIPASDGQFEVHYFGLSPIPLAFYIGTLVQNFPHSFGHNRDRETKSWNWASDENTTSASVQGMPTEMNLAAGEVTISISVSGSIDERNVALVVPHAMKHIEIRLPDPKLNELKSEAESDHIANLFLNTIEKITQCLPNTTCVHLFASVPCGLAFTLGTRLNPTIHKKIKLYQFSAKDQPAYTHALTIGSEETASPTEPVRNIKKIRKKFSENHTKKLIPFVQSQKTHSQEEESWTQEALKSDAPDYYHLHGFSGLPKIHTDTLQPIIGSTIAPDNVEGPFFDSTSSTWNLSDFLISSLLRTVGKERLERAIRMILFHEIVHPNQGITTNNYNSVGDFSRSIERLDYQADVYAQCYELSYSKLFEPQDANAGISFLRDSIETAIDTIWAFNWSGKDIEELEERAFVRLLTMYWNWSIVTSKNNIREGFEYLFSQPIIEFSGLRKFMKEQRAHVDFSVQTKDLEVAVIHNGTMKRFGNSNSLQLENLTKGFREHNCELIKSCMLKLRDHTIQN